jgi:hypothetical protein
MSLTYKYQPNRILHVFTEIFSYKLQLIVNLKKIINNSFKLKLGYKFIFCIMIIFHV